MKTVKEIWLQEDEDNVISGRRDFAGKKKIKEGGDITTLIIGGGQAGLSVGYHLAEQGIRFLILDANERIGDSWRLRWDSLRLFSPARYNGLDGMPFPGPPHYFPTKEEMADYLAAYVKRFQLPVQTGVYVDRVSKEKGKFVVQSGHRQFEADNVVVAMSSFQKAKIPAFADALDSSIVQIHSSDYRNLSQLQPGPVLIVGAGNSGAEIAMEAARRHPVWLSGRDTGHLPFRISGKAAKVVLLPLFLRFIFHRLLSIDTFIGRKIRPKLISVGGPLIRTFRKDLHAAGIKSVPRTSGVRNGKPLLEDGRVLEVKNIIWCTGYHPNFSWIDLPVFENSHEPKHKAGILAQEPGLYFVGLHFLYALSSTMIHGVGRDARRIAKDIAMRTEKTSRV